MNILVTGGAGYIGSILVPDLLDRGAYVTVLDNFAHGQNSLGHVCYNEKLRIVRADVCDQDIMLQEIRRADVIIPLAALVGAPLCKQNSISAQSVNVEAIRYIVNNLSPQQQVVFPVTNSGYGLGQGNTYCTEESPLKPISLYGQTKVEAEKIIMDRENSVAFRLATVFGMAPRMRLDLLVNDFCYRACRDRSIVVFEGHFKRNYIHVRDVSYGFRFALDNFESMRGNTFNMGLSDANLSKMELIQRIQLQLPELVYIEAPIGEDPDKRNYIVSNEKLENAGWQPQFGLDQGIRELLTGFQMIRNERYSNV